MSFYTFAADNLTTVADRKRRPAIDAGQVLRTLVLFLSLVALLAVMARKQTHAADHLVDAPAQSEPAR